MDSSYLVQAIVECEQTVTADLTNHSQQQAAFRNLGNLLQGIGQFDRAIIWHSLASESEVNLGEVYSQLGELYILEQDWSAALTCFEKALEYFPHSARIYSSLAQINGQLQRRDAEMEYWYKATEINPNLVNHNGYYKLAKALENKGKIAEAIACYQKSTQGEAGIIEAFYDLGEIYQRQRQLDQAKTAYEQILTVRPDDAKAQYKLGTVHLQQQSFEQAIEYFHQTIKNAPDFPWAYRDLVKTFLILKKWDEAISTCYAILNLVEEYPWVYGHLGDALREKGRPDEAAVNFQQACLQRGWHKCQENNYYFTQDLFSYRIPLWTEYLQSLISPKEVEVLEVGGYQGMSCCWMLDNILTHQTSNLTCIDINYSLKFKENIAKTGSESQVTCLEGDISELLSNCALLSFDLIHFQDRCRLTEATKQNSLLAWKLLKPGGLIVFNHYSWRNPGDPNKNPRQGIDQFLKVIEGQWKLVYKSPQPHPLVIRKLE